MLHRPRIPELAQRDRFIRRAVSEGRVLTFADEETASVPSQKVRGRTVQLFWSSPIEATRWAEALAGNNELQWQSAVQMRSGLGFAPGISAGAKLLNFAAPSGLPGNHVFDRFSKNMVQLIEAAINQCDCGHPVCKCCHGCQSAVRKIRAVEVIFKQFQRCMRAAHWCLC